MNKVINPIFIVSIILWCFITLVRVFHHCPWYDESHAWAIAQELNIFEIFKYMKIEGHTFLWYLLLMPIAKTNFMYPYSMLLLNWIFCFISVLILWVKSPFNNWIKVLITFSFPFFALYSVIARCYAVGIMFLFILISMDKVKLKYPVLYSFLLILCANTSLMGCVPATVLGVRFACDLIKDKQNVLIPFSIAGFGAVLILLQLFGCVESGLSIYTNNDTLFSAVLRSLKYNSFYYWMLISFVTLILSIIFYIKNKIFPSFLLFTLLLLAGIFCVYAGRIWHLFFIYIYFICSCWLVLIRPNSNEYKFKACLSLALIIVSFACILYRPVDVDSKMIFKNNKSSMAKEFLADANLENAVIILSRQFDTSIQPYLKYSSIKLVNYCSNEVLNYDTTDYLSSENCRLDTVLDSALIRLDKRVFDKWYSDKLYLLTNKLKLIGIEQNFGYKFTLYKKNGENYLWKVEKVK